MEEEVTVAVMVEEAEVVGFWEVEVVSAWEGAEVKPEY
jgi:hypothetical protein